MTKEQVAASWGDVSDLNKRRTTFRDAEIETWYYTYRTPSMGYGYNTHISSVVTFTNGKVSSISQ
jgi:hypothetical protein